MSTIITLETIKAEQGRLAEMIAALEAQAQAGYSIYYPERTIELQPGEEYAGIIIGQDGEPSYDLILLPGEAEGINWADAKGWARGAGGELPSRREQALLYANLKGHFQAAWYWSAEAHASDSDYAWYQYFYGGNQYFITTITKLRARAVRRSVIE